MTKDTGGQAFPIPNRDYLPAYGGAPGMTLRDYFASNAPVSLRDAMSMEGVPNLARAKPDEVERVFMCLAEMRFMYADAMLRERSREEGK